MTSSIEEKLAKGLSITELLNLIKDENRGSQFKLTLSTLGKAAFLTYSSIRYCEQKQMISMNPTSNNAYVFNVTAKGHEFLKKKNSKVQVSS